MSGDLEAAVLSSSDYDEWNTFVAGCPEGSIYSDSRYLAVLSRATGGTFRIAAVRRDGQLLGGIALYIEKMGGLRVVSPRYLLYFNGFVVSPTLPGSPATQTSTLLHFHSAMLRYLDKQKFDRIYIKTRPPETDFRMFFRHGWSAAPSYSYVVPLDDLDLLWSRTDRNLRRLVKRCEASGLRLSKDVDFDSFWRLHIQTHERKGSPVYLPRAAFEKYIRDLHSLSLCQLYQVRRPDNRTVATLLVLANEHEVCHTVAAASDVEYLNAGVSAFVRWMSFKDLASQGYAANDLTDASLNSVTRFKSQLGGELALAIEIQQAENAIVKWRFDIADLRARIGARLRRFIN